MLVLFPILIALISPLIMLPYQTDDSFPITTSPIIVAFGAINVFK
jgi:hypothetical protein